MAETSIQAEALEEVLTNCILGCQKQDWQVLDTVIDLLVRTYQVDAKRITLEDAMIQKVYLLFSKVDYITLKDHLNFHYSINANIFRLLRNCCAGSPRNIELLVRNTKFLDAIICWLRYHTNKLSNDTEEENDSNHDKMLIAIKCCLQFLANAVGGQSQDGDPMKRYIWQNFDFNTQRKLLNTDCPGVRKITTAIIYNCMLDDGIFRSVVDEFPILVSMIDGIIFELRTDHPSEWSYFILQRILEHQVAVGDLLQNIPMERSINFIDVMTNMLTQDNAENRAPRISEYNLIPIFRLLKHNLVDLKIEKSVQERKPRNFELIFALLRLACEVTANEHSQYSFLEDEELFKLTSTVLQIIHKVYKQSPLREALRIDFPPSFSAAMQMKKNLVRLIANLAYNRPAMQNLANKIDTVPLILDLAHYDYQNPFIREWAIVATRNLLKDNPANQAIVRGIFNACAADQRSIREQIKERLAEQNRL